MEKGQKQSEELALAEFVALISAGVTSAGGASPAPTKEYKRDVTT